MGAKNKGNIPATRVLKRAKYHLRRGRGRLLRYGLNRLRWHRAPRTTSVSAFPEHVDLELSSTCDLRCPMCYTVTERFKREVPHKIMDFDLFTRLIDQCVAGRAYSVRLSLRGEAFLHPRLVDMVAYAKRRGIPEVSSLTNNHRLDIGTFGELLEAGLDWLTISFDGLGEDYDRIRWPNTFEASIGKIRAYHAVKKSLGSEKPLIKVQSIWPAVANDPQAYFDAFEGIVDDIAINPIIDYTGLQDPAALLYEENFTCAVPWQRLAVFSDGRVPMCHNDAYGESIVGDARTTPLAAIWHSQALRSERETQLAGCGVECNSACAGCYLPRKTSPLVVELRDRTLPLYEYAVAEEKESARLIENLERHEPRRRRTSRARGERGLAR